MKCLKCDSVFDERGCFLPLSDQDLYDFIDPNPDEDPALSECDGQQSSHVSCIKVRVCICLSKRIISNVKEIRTSSPGDKISYRLLVPDVMFLCLCVFQELEKVLNMSHQSKDKDGWKEESG